MDDKKYIEEVIEMAAQNVKRGHGGPFAAMVVKDGNIIAKAVNTVTHDHDPTAHAEVNAIRKACQQLNDFQLTDCTIYSSCEPCPMCLGAIYWARPKKLVFAASKLEAANAGFDDDFIYQEIDKPINNRKLKTTIIDSPNRLKPFIEWSRLTHKKEY